MGLRVDAVEDQCFVLHYWWKESFDSHDLVDLLQAKVAVQENAEIVLFQDHISWMVLLWHSLERHSHVYQPSRLGDGQL